MKCVYEVGLLDSVNSGEKDAWNGKITTYVKEEFPLAADAAKGVNLQPDNMESPDAEIKTLLRHYARHNDIRVGRHWLE